MKKQPEIIAKARELGCKLEIPVFRFLKSPLTRAFGEAFFEELEVVYRELQKQVDQT